jgi:molybdopterin molybdotransferase
VPEYANVVVPQEQTEATEDHIQLIQKVIPSQHIRRRGEDIEAGSVIIAAGTPLSPAHLALAASVGVSSLEVQAKLRVAIMFTGDELTEPGQPLAPGGIYNSNRYAIRALLEKLGCEITDLGIVRDSAQATREALQKASAIADVIITCGGVSVGEEDHVKAAVQALGQLNLWQIAMKPGKPLAYGKVGTADFIGLPGNPVSAFVTFVLMARPFLLKRMGATNLSLNSIPAVAGFNWPKPDRRREFLRAGFERNEQGVSALKIWPNQGSGVMSSVAWADGLIDVPANTTISKGDTVNFIPLSELMG